MTYRCEICEKLEPDREMIFGCSCQVCGRGGDLHYVHEACAERIGIWGPPSRPWGVMACPELAKVAGLLMAEDE